MRQKSEEGGVRGRGIMYLCQSWLFEGYPTVLLTIYFGCGART